MEIQHPLSYQEFLSAPGAFADRNGPWVFNASSRDVSCGSSTAPVCVDTIYCLTCTVSPTASQSSYTVSFFTEITFNLTDYGGSTISYEWQFKPWWGGTKATIGSDLEMKSSVGDQVYTDTLKVANRTAFYYNGDGWYYDPFKHSDSATFSTNSEKTLGYIPLMINLTFPHQDQELVNYFMKNMLIKITTPIVTSNTQSPSSTPTQSPSSTPNPSNNPTSIPTPSNVSSPIKSSSETSNPTPGSSPGTNNKVFIGALIGGLIGMAILVTVLILGVLFFWMRRNRRNINHVDLAVPEVPESSPIRPFNIDSMREANSTVEVNRQRPVSDIISTAEQPPAYQEAGSSHNETRNIQFGVESSNGGTSSLIPDVRHEARSIQRQQMSFSKRP